MKHSQHLAPTTLPPSQYKYVPIHDEVYNEDLGQRAKDKDDGAFRRPELQETSSTVKYLPSFRGVMKQTRRKGGGTRR